MLALFSMLLVTKSADTGAYAFGRSFGRHKMTPLLSPGKDLGRRRGRHADRAASRRGPSSTSLGPWLVTSRLCRAARWSRRWSMA